jgi:hypothetical protein
MEERFHFQEDAAMGRLPIQFGKDTIKFRQPWALHSELDVAPNVNGELFPDGQLYVNTDKPEEYHEVKVTLTALDAEGAVLDPQPEHRLLSKLIRLKIKDLEIGEDITKIETPVEDLIDDETHIWAWDEPRTMTKGGQFQIAVTSEAFPNVCVVGADCDTLTSTAVAFVRVGVTFKGFRLIIAPPLPTR